MICFRYFCQKLFFLLLGRAHNDPFVQIGGGGGESNKQFLIGFSNIFRRTTGLQHKLLKLIESPKIFHWN